MAPGGVWVFGDAGQMPAEMAARWCAALPPFRQRRVAAYRFEKDRRLSLAAFCLLCVALGHIPPAFVTGENQKPALRDGGPHFNITHSDSCVAVAVGPAPLGIDAEALGAAPFEVMDQVFTPAEIAAVRAAPKPDTAFFTLWTLKESYSKMLGAGLGFPFKDIAFAPGVGGGFVFRGAAPAVFETRALCGNVISLCGEAGPWRVLGAAEFEAAFESLLA